MKKKKLYRHVYGPVDSWRLGRSLGIDAVCRLRRKACSFDCVYCQAGKTRILTEKRKIFIPAGEILKEVKNFPPFKADYITFSGSGEPTLAKNLGRLIKGIKKLRREKVAVITNATLLARKDVRRDLAQADFVFAKLDAHSEKLFRKINRPAKTIKLKNILKGIKRFGKEFKGKFALQIMFTAANKKHARQMAALAREIRPGEVHINTPTRPSGVKPLSKGEMQKIKRCFNGRVRCCYSRRRAGRAYGRDIRRAGKA